MNTNELNWISKHQNQLRKLSGKWIAVLDDQLITSGNSVKEVMAAVRKRGIKKLPLVTKIPRKDEGPYILIVL